MYDIKLVGTSQEEIQQGFDLLRLVFPTAHHITPAYLDWEYRQNPTGQVVGFNAFSDQQLVAHYVTIPIVARLLGKETKGLLSLNTATHPNHQGKKLFTTLASETYDYGKANGYTFVVGVANANSTHGFVNKLGFQLIQPLTVRIGWGAVPQSITGSQVDFERVWTPESISWRLRNPSIPYTVCKGKNHFQVLAPSGKAGIQVLLGEFSLSQYPNEEKHSKISFLSRFTPQLWMGVNNSINWSGSFYFDLPNRLRPSPLNLIFKDLTGSGIRLDSKSLVFRAIDFDAY